MAVRWIGTALLVLGAFALGWVTRGDRPRDADTPAPARASTPDSARDTLAPHPHRPGHPTLQGAPMPRSPGSQGRARTAPPPEPPGDSATPVVDDAVLNGVRHVLELRDLVRFFNDAPQAPAPGGLVPPMGEGVLRATSSDGRIWIEAGYRNGALHGAWRLWHANGERASDGTYVEGRMDGAWRTYHENGERATETTHGASGPEGVARTWDEDGALVVETTFVAGRAEGPHRRWHPGGRTVSEEGRHVAGAKDGRWTW